MVGIDDICGHPEPVGKAEADSLLMCDLQDAGIPGGWEQLWARRSGGQEYVLCTIPFFAAGIALGDALSVDSSGQFELTVDAVVRDGGNTTFRVIFREDAEDHETAERQDELLGRVRDLGLVYEVFQPGYVAVDCPARSPERDELVKVLEAFSLLEWSDFEDAKRGG